MLLVIQITIVDYVNHVMETVKNVSDKLMTIVTSVLKVSIDNQNQIVFLVELIVQMVIGMMNMIELVKLVLVHVTGVLVHLLMNVPVVLLH